MQKTLAIVAILIVVTIVGHAITTEALKSNLAQVYPAGSSGIGSGSSGSSGDSGSGSSEPITPIKDCCKEAEKYVAVWEEILKEAMKMKNDAGYRDLINRYEGGISFPAKDGDVKDVQKILKTEQDVDTFINTIALPRLEAAKKKLEECKDLSPTTCERVRGEMPTPPVIVPPTPIITLPVVTPTPNPTAPTPIPTLTVVAKKYSGSLNYSISNGVVTIAYTVKNNNNQVLRGIPQIAVGPSGSIFKKQNPAVAIPAGETRIMLFRFSVKNTPKGSRTMNAGFLVNGKLEAVSAGTIVIK